MRIISPWTIYWITRLEAIGVTLVVAALCLVGGAFCVAMFSDINGNGIPKDKIKKMLAGAVILAVLAAFVPSERTAIEMLIADNVTYETVDKALERIGEVADHVIDKIKEEE